MLDGAMVVAVLSDMASSALAFGHSQSQSYQPSQHPRQPVSLVPPWEVLCGDWPILGPFRIHSGCVGVHLGFKGRYMIVWCFIYCRGTAWLVTVAVQRRGCYESLIWFASGMRLSVHTHTPVHIRVSTKVLTSPSLIYAYIYIYTHRAPL